MIVGTGIDIVEIERITAIIERSPKILERILTEQERAKLPEVKRKQIEYLAGRFAAKEAFSKALGVGVGSEFSWHDISIHNDVRGKPEIYFHHAHDSDPNWQNRKVHLSISHEQKFVVAFVIIEEG
jgi:holo-[acyl-carrier protein] synthase